MLPSQLLNLPKFINKATFPILYVFFLVLVLF